MMRLAEMKISNKIAAIFIVLMLVMGIGGSVGLYNASKIAEVTSLLYSDSFKRTETLSTLEKEFMSQRQEVFLHIIVADEGSKSFLESSIKERRAKIEKLLEEYKRHSLDTHIRGALKRFTTNLNDYWDVQARVLEASSAGKGEEALSIIRGEGNRAFNMALNGLKDLLGAERTAASNAYLRSEQLARIITIVTLLFTIAAIIVAAGLWLAFTRSIVRPILLIEESARKMARGDLKQRAVVASNDDIGSLAREFNEMAKSLEESYATLERKVEERTEELRRANEELTKKKQELEIKNEELARASRMKSQFLANVSHELRTPLNSIIGFSELLQEKSFGELNEKQAQYVRFIHTSGNHLLHLINSILDLSKIEAGRMELMIEKFPLADVLGEVLGAIKPIAHKRNISIETKVAPASPVISADKGMFKQIMFNLLSNAVKFNVDGGKVFIDWNITDEPEGMAMQRYLYISVKDTGVGIKDEDLKRLFREFEQLDPSVTREHGGTGLGLALTKKLVELHQGQIMVESKAGKGCKFTVRLPQGSEKIEVLQIHTPVADVDKKADKESPLILIAGESADINHLLQIYLSGENYDVLTVPDGVELVKMAKEKHPFAIVTGVSIPKKDGWEVMRELKASEETKDIPVVIISSANNKELGFALGAVDYLVKPIDREKLLDTLGRLHFMRSMRGRTLNILVVDDDPQVLTLLGDILEKEKFNVLKASGGEEAVRMAIEDEPDLIILDLMMPEVSGFDVVERLKDHPVAKNIPIIIFSAKEITEDDKKRLGTNIDKIIKKASFSREDLLAEIRLLELAYPERANMVDRVTRLFNRRYFDIILSREISRCERYKQTCAVLLIDIDDFASYNRINGVTNGDEALREMSQIIKNNLRKSDCVTRYGGDEFAILLPGIDGDEPLRVAEKLRVLVENHTFPAVEGEQGQLTISVSVTNLPVQGKADIIENLETAVKNIYDGGGNKVVFCMEGGGEY